MKWATDPCRHGDMGDAMALLKNAQEITVERNEFDTFVNLLSVKVEAVRDRLHWLARWPNDKWQSSGIVVVSYAFRFCFAAAAPDETCCVQFTESAWAPWTCLAL